MRVYQEKTKASSKKTPRRNPGLMSRLSAAALNVSSEDIRSYDPDGLDISVAQSMLEGAISVPEISEASGKGEAAVRKRLRDPIAFAWIAQQVSRLIQTRVGLVDAALLRKAVAGDVKAIDLFYRRYGKLVDLQIVAHGQLGDVSLYSDADLDALVAAAVKQDAHLLPSSALSPSNSSVSPETSPTEEQL